MNKKLSSLLASFLCGSCLTLGIWGCTAGSFAITVHNAPIFIYVILLSAVLSVCISLRKRTWFSLVIAFSSALILLLQYSAVLEAVLYCAGRILNVYSNTFPSLSQVARQVYLAGGDDGTAAFMLLSVFFVAPTVYVIGAGKQMEICFLFTHPLLMLCLIPNYALPPAYAILLVLGTDLLMILTQPLRLSDQRSGNRLLVRLVLPVLVFVLLLTLIIDPADKEQKPWVNTFQTRIEAMRDDFALWVDQLLNRDKERDMERPEKTSQSSILLEALPDAFSLDELDGTDLTKLLSKLIDGQAVLTVELGDREVCYLRGVSFGAFSGNTWALASPADYGTARIPADMLFSRDPEAAAEISIHTEKELPLLFTTYYPTGINSVCSVYYDSYVINRSHAADYKIGYSSTQPAGRYEGNVPEVYLEVPEVTREGLADITAELQSMLPENAAVAEIAGTVASYVRSSALYSTECEQLPDGADFVTWFLKECDAGYCIHFATSAAALLRCMNVPARYVTGFLVRSDGNAKTVVTQNNGHAWVEYYSEETGWTLLDPTPSSYHTASEEAPDNPPAPAPTHGDALTKDEDRKDSKTEKEASVAETNNRLSVAAIAGITLIVLCTILAGWNLHTRKRRAKALTAGDCNEQTAALYRHIALLYRLQGKEPPQSLTVLALEARFSNHELDEAAVERLRRILAQERSHLLQSASLPKKLWYIVFRGL